MAYPMKYVIIVNGPPRAGKDTTVHLMRAALPVPSVAFSSIEPVKAMLERYVDLSRKTPADRKLLATVGDALQEHSEFRTEACLRESDHFFHRHRAGAFFCHIREPHLIRMLRKSWIARGRRVATVYVDGKRAETNFSNDTDRRTGEMQYDFTLRNDGTIEQLNDLCRQVLSEIELIA